jgi:hypothetical protein
MKDFVSGAFQNAAHTIFTRRASPRHPFAARSGACARVRSAALRKALSMGASIL